MKSNAKRLWAFIIAAVMVISMLPVMAMAAGTETVAEGTATFADDAAAFNGEVISFTAAADGDVTVEISEATPGWYVDVYENGEWIVDYSGTEADSVTFAATSGASYEVLICSYTVYSESLKFATAGSVTYKVTVPTGGSSVETLAEGTAEFADDAAAFNGEAVTFTAASNGEVTVEIIDATPGWYVDVYENGEWIVDYSGTEAGSVTFDATSGTSYEVLICSYTVYSESLKFATAGSVTYKVTFASSGESSSEEPTEPTEPADVPGSSQDNPKPITGSEWTFIDAGQTVWYIYDNYQNMVENGVYSMMLHVNSSADYTVVYRGQEVPVDADGFVNYEMMDMTMQGQYLFSVTNNSAEEMFFGIEVSERPEYVNNGDVLVLGDNAIVLDTSAVFTLYEFSPSQTGVYLITAEEGVVGHWGTSFNPVDNTTEKTNTLEWTCTAVGQHVMVGFTGAETTIATVERIGDYVPTAEIPWEIYENTYDFSYEVPNGETFAIDLTDGNEHTAYLGEDGFYYYGEEGYLMVADLSSAEINIQEGYYHGGLKAWLLDEDGNTISKIDYNDAMFEYYLAGLVPVTEELATMIQEVGIANFWWTDGGLVFTESAPADTDNAWMQLCDYLVEAEATGVTVSGTLTGAADEDAWVELWQGDEFIDLVDVIDGTYTLENVAPGSYTLVANGYYHLEREYDLTVEDTDVTLDVQICMYGDVNGDGQVNIGDVGKLYAHCRGTALITDEYLLACYDINEDGKTNIGDVGLLYALVTSDDI